MIVHQYIKDFENMGLGMFVHFGLYSILGRGEWSMHHNRIDVDVYRKLADSFCPAEDWATKLVATAKNAGCRYITLTARHHDGYSLYDTCGLNTYNAPHYIDRDLVAEFVDACRNQDIVPFFYHTTLDWIDPRFNSDFPVYLAYLRDSVRLLCTNYGKIGGIWFDGNWSRKDADWEEDALYSMIRALQPTAMIINNTGLGRLGELGHPELDSVTFERGKVTPINLEGSPKYIASEMCEVFGTHWGYAEKDFLYKSPADIIKEICDCRRHGANMLLNVGPTANGYLSDIDAAFYGIVAKWTNMFGEAIRLPRPCGIQIQNKQNDFLLRDKNNYYLFCYDLGMSADPNVTRESMKSAYEDIFELPAGEKILSVSWLDDNTPLDFEIKNGQTIIKTLPYLYGCNYVVRVAKITIQEK